MIIPGRSYIQNLRLVSSEKSNLEIRCVYHMAKMHIHEISLWVSCKPHTSSFVTFQVVINWSLLLEIPGRISLCKMLIGSVEMILEETF